MVLKCLYIEGVEITFWLKCHFKKKNKHQRIFTILEKYLKDTPIIGINQFVRNVPVRLMRTLSVFTQRHTMVFFNWVLAGVYL